MKKKTSVIRSKETKMSKSEFVRTCIKTGKMKEALREAKDFRIGVSREQRSAMARAYECIVHPDFYRSIGKDIQRCIDEGITILTEVLA